MRGSACPAAPPAPRAAGSLCGDPRNVPRIADVVIHDPHDTAPLPAHALVLAVGVREPGEIARLLRELGEAGAAALVVRAPVPPHDAVRAAADASGVVLLGLAPEVSWAVAASVLRALGPGREPAPVSTRPPVTCSAWPRRWPSSSAHP